MKPNEIHELWRKDSEIDQYDLAKESSNIPQLHARYLKLLSEARENYRTEKERLNKLKFAKFEYFSGRMSTDELKRRQWKPFPHKVLKNDIDKYVDADSDIVAQKLKLGEANECVNVLESIVDHINKKTFVIKNMIEWNKFTNGVI